jgi:hypothetical protein
VTVCVYRNPSSDKYAACIFARLVSTSLPSSWKCVVNTWKTDDACVIGILDDGQCTCVAEGVYESSCATHSDLSPHYKIRISIPSNCLKSGVTQSSTAIHVTKEVLNLTRRDRSQYIKLTL